jgi:hypothetical protein
MDPGAGELQVSPLGIAAHLFRCLLSFTLVFRHSILLLYLCFYVFAFPSSSHTPIFAHIERQNDPAIDKSSLGLNRGGAAFGGELQGFGEGRPEGFFRQPREAFRKNSTEREFRLVLQPANLKQPAILAGSYG